MHRELGTGCTAQFHGNLPRLMAHLKPRATLFYLVEHGQYGFASVSCAASNFPLKTRGVGACREGRQQMAKTAVSQLQEQIEAIRREAFAAGFEAAMQAVRHFASTHAPDKEPQSAQPVRRRSAQRPRTSGQRGQMGDTSGVSRRGTTSAPRPQRGTNARLVEEVLQSNAPRALRPAEIRSTIQRQKGVAIALIFLLAIALWAGWHRHQTSEQATSQQEADRSSEITIRPAGKPGLEGDSDQPVHSLAGQPGALHDPRQGR